MHWSKKSAIIGGILTVALLVFVMMNASDFSGIDGGRVLLGVSVLSAMLVFPASAVRYEKKRWFYYVLILLVFLLVPLVMEIVVERLNGKFITEFYSKGDWFDNYFLILLLYAFVFALSGSTRVSILVMSPVLLLFGIANFFVKEFKGGPLLPQDFGSIVTAANVAGGYTYTIGYEIVFGIAVTALVMAVAAKMGMPYIKKKVKWIIRAAIILVIAVYCVIFYGTDTFAKMGYKPDFFNQTRGYERHGAVMEFTLNTKYLWLSEPKGYDAEEIGNIVEEKASEDVPNILKTALVRQGMSEKEAEEAVSVETAGSRGEKPNIIVIMNESLSDLRVDGDFTTNEEFMPFMDSLEENTIKGYSYVSVFGSGTSNTEYEFLTGNTMAFMPAGSNAYQAYIKDTQPGLTSTLLSQGYTADAFHPYNRSSWNRTNVYNFMGFRSFTTIEDLIDEDILESYRSTGNDYLFIRRVQARYPDADMLLRKYVSDEYDYKKVIEMYENKEEGEPFYLFNVTMQNHSPYNKTFANFPETISLTSPAGSYRKADQYLSLVKASDEAFQELVEYFQEQDEPTVILMFGDHQPFVESDFYSNVMGQNVADMDDETMQKRYITNFILWANYDIPEGQIDMISMNYLSTLLLQVVGLDMPEYNKYLANLYTEIPVISAAGCIDSDGNFFLATSDGEESEEITEEIKNYRYIAYNNVADTANREDDVFYLDDAG